MNGDVSFQMGIKGVLLDPAGRVLVLRVNGRQHCAAEAADYWDLPGGRVAWGDIVRDAAGRIPDWDATVHGVLRREIEEETGLRDVRIGAALPVVHAAFPEYPAASGEKVFLLLRPYLCSVEANPALRLSAEHREARWYAPEEAAALLSVKWGQALTAMLNTLPQPKTRG